VRAVINTLFLNNDVPMGVGGREKTKQNLRQMFLVPCYKCKTLLLDL
jgi:hypothetical protein